MGIEYTIRFGNVEAPAVAKVLRRLPMVREVSANGIDFEMRGTENSGQMPDASVSIEEGGIYFCDYGGAGREFLGWVISRLVSEFGPVTVEDRE